MQVIDPAGARMGLTLAGAVFLSELALTVIQRVIGLGSLGILIELAWLSCTAGLLVAAWKLSRALDDTELPKILLGLTGLLILFDLFWIWQLRLSAEQMVHLPIAVNVINLLAGAGVTVGWAILLAQLASNVSWAVAAAAAAGLLSVGRAMVNVAGMLRLLDLHDLSWIRTGVSLLISLVLGVLALATSRAGPEFVAPGATSFPGSDPLPGRAGWPAPLSPAATDAGHGAGRLIAVGAVLLAIGVGVTVASFAAAEGGGTYVVATGAIATGVVQLVRGLGRLGSGS